MSNVEIREDGLFLGPADTAGYANIINFKSPLTATVNVVSGIANVGANTSRISDLPAITDAIGNDVLLIVTNASSIPVTERISVADFFGNVQANSLFAANVTAIANVYVQNSAAIIVGNSTVNTIYATGYVSISNGSETANLEPGVFKSGQTSANSTRVIVGVNAQLNSSSLLVGDSSSNTIVGFANITVSNSTYNVKVDTGIISIGNASVNVVANATSIKLSNSTSSVTIKTPNTVQVSNATYFLNANGDWAIVTGASAVAGGSNTNIQFNNSASMAGTNAFSFNSDTNTVSISNTLIIGNSTVNALSNSTLLKISNSTSNVTVDTGSVSIGNSTVNNKISISLVSVANSTGIANVQPGVVTVGSSLVNTTAVAVGANATVTVSGFKVEGSAGVGNSVVNSSSLYVGNSLTSTTISKDKIDLGSTSANLVINANAIKISNSTVDIAIALPTAGQKAATNYFLSANGDWASVVPVSAIGGDNNQVQFSVSGALAGTNGFTFDTTTNAISLGNSTVVATVNSTSIKVGNTSTYATVNTTAFKINNSSANITIGAANTTQANGKFFLNGNGSWVDINTSGLITPTAPIPNGSNTYIQFNDSGVMRGLVGFTYNKDTNNVIVGNNLTAASLYASGGNVVIGNSTVYAKANVISNVATILLANSSSNTRLAIPTAAQYANTTTFLHANGSWVEIGSVFIGGAAGATGTLQFSAGDGTQTGNANIKIVDNNSIVLANTSSNTKISIPTTSQRNDKHSLLHANGEWVHVRRVLRIKDDDWFFGRSPQSFFDAGWRFLSNNTVQFADDQPTADWQTLSSGTVKVGGDSEASPGSGYTVHCHASCKTHGARYYNYPIFGYHSFFDNYWWVWNDRDVDIVFRFVIGNNQFVSEPIEIPFFTVNYRKHQDSGKLEKSFTNVGEGDYVVKFQAKLANPGSDPIVAVKGRKLRIDQ